LSRCAGAWLIVGPSLYPLWSEPDIEPIGGSETTVALMWIGYCYGTGALIVFRAGLYEGLLARRQRRATTHVEDTTAVDEPVVVTGPERPLRVG
jgi:hypothetical protein